MKIKQNCTKQHVHSIQVLLLSNPMTTGIAQ